RAITHEALAVTAQVGDADVIAPDHENVGLPSRHDNLPGSVTGREREVSRSRSTCTSPSEGAPTGPAMHIGRACGTLSTVAVDVSRVRDVPVFRGMSDEQLHAIATRFEERHVLPDHNMTTEGGGGYFFFVIESGSARVFQHGKEAATFGPG